MGDYVIRVRKLDEFGTFKPPQIDGVKTKPPNPGVSYHPYVSMYSTNHLCIALLLVSLSM